MSKNSKVFVSIFVMVFVVGLSVLLWAYKNGKLKSSADVQIDMTNGSGYLVDVINFVNYGAVFDANTIVKNSKAELKNYDSKKGYIVANSDSATTHQYRFTECLSGTTSTNCPTTGVFYEVKAKEGFGIDLTQYQFSQSQQMARIYYNAQTKIGTGNSYLLEVELISKTGTETPGVTQSDQLIALYPPQGSIIYTHFQKFNLSDPKFGVYFQNYKEDKPDVNVVLSDLLGTAKEKSTITYALSGSPDIKNWSNWGKEIEFTNNNINLGNNNPFIKTVKAQGSQDQFFCAGDELGCAITFDTAQGKVKLTDYIPSDSQYVRVKITFYNPRNSQGTPTTPSLQGLLFFVLQTSTSSPTAKITPVPTNPGGLVSTGSSLIVYVGIGLVLSALILWLVLREK